MATRRILIVEDDPVSLKLTRDVLRAKGHETAEAGSGPAALAHVAGSPVDLVVLDIGLPGIDGVEVARRLKGDPATRHLPVIAVTAYALPAEQARIRAAGCDACLTKPLRFLEFLAVVEDLLASSEIPSDDQGASASGTEK